MSADTHPLVTIPFRPTSLAQLKKYLKPGDHLTAIHYLWREVRGLPQVPVVLKVSRVLRDTIEFAPAGHITASTIGFDDTGRVVNTQVADFTYADLLPPSHYDFTPDGFAVRSDRGQVLARYLYGAHPQEGGNDGD